MIIFSAHIPEVRGGSQTLACGWCGNHGPSQNASQNNRFLNQSSGPFISLTPTMTLFLCSPTWENRGLTPFWLLPCSFTMPTSWPPGVCTTSAPTTTVFVRSSARKSNQNLQVRLCGPHLSSSHHLWPKGLPSLPLRRNIDSPQLMENSLWSYGSHRSMWRAWPKELYVGNPLWRTSWLGGFVWRRVGEGLFRIPCCRASRDCWFTLVREGERTWVQALCVQLCNVRQVIPPLMNL